METLAVLLSEFFNLTLALLVFGAVMLLIEDTRPVRPLKFIRREFWNDIAYAYTAALAIPLFQLFYVFLAARLLTPFVPYQAFDSTIQEWPFWLQVLLGVLILDCATYVRHRFMHEHLWPVHAIHHSAREINWLTKFRLHPLEIIITVLVTSLVLHVAGFSGNGIIAAQMILQGMDLFNHTNIRLGFPAPFCYLLSSPDYHKWHHVAEPRATNKNYVVVFPFIDLLFKSYFYPQKEAPGKFGIIASGNSAAVPAQFAQQLLFPFRWRRKSRR